jgi:competence ComEA-like helix-hairpin-helix protein
MKLFHRVATCLAGVLFLLPLAAQDDQETRDRRAENVKIAADLADGPGKLILVQRCGDCHSLARVTAGRKSLISWRNTINVMVANGAIFEDKDTEPLAQYLAANFALAVNVNSATASELSGVPGLEAQLAAAIIGYREKNGRFAAVQDLKKVPGVTDEILGKIASRITVGPPSR